MHVTLHITTNCNLNCKYCYSPPPGCGTEMTTDVIDKAIDFSMKEFDKNIGIIFFGGEPLLRKDLIEYAIDRCKRLEKEADYKMHFHFKMTTNGTLLDDEFLKYSEKVGLNIGLSIDGNSEAHNMNRVFRHGGGSFEVIEKNLNDLIKYQPYANSLMVITPENVNIYAKSVEYLIERGFKYIIASMNYAGEWTDEHLEELERQYLILSDLYIKWTLEERKFYFSPFEMKLANYIRGNEDECYTCQLSKRQISIAPDGKIYPCVQFVKDGISNTEFSIGDVWQGFDSRREHLFAESIAPKSDCKECALKDRCYNTCSCLNWQTTGFINTVSPLLCASEQILIPIVDKLGEELYKRKAPMFIQKQYNTAYPLLSLMEDEMKKK